MESQNNSEVKKPIRFFPFAPRGAKVNLQIILWIFTLAIIAGGTWTIVHFTGGGKSNTGVVGGNDKNALSGSINTWTGFAPIVALNDGKEPNKESRMYKEFGLLLKINQMDVRSNCIEALKNDEVDFIYTTTDISPTEMGASGDLAALNVVQILKIDDSRGADVIVSTRSIKTVQDLKGKKIAVAQMTASHTLLLRVLETAGLTQNDVEIVKVGDGIEAAKMFKAGEVPVAVVWSPDDGDCIKAIDGAHVLTSTKFATSIIMDGIIVKKETLKKKWDAFVKLGTAWLTINAEMCQAQKLVDVAAFNEQGAAYKLPPALENVAAIFAREFNADKFVTEDGLLKVRFSTYGDNVDFFGLNTAFDGVTGDNLYSKMSRVYGDIGYAKNPLPWRQVSDPSLIQAITTLTGPTHAAEAKTTFAAPDENLKKAPALSTKKVTVTFESGKWLLDDVARDVIDREFGSIAKSWKNARIRIEGNTDNIGNAKSNQTLSKKRAQAVADYLAQTYRLDANKFIIVGNGPNKPVPGCEANANESQKSQNRRTDFELVTE